MKKQINPTTKAHLIRGAFYLLLLLTVCAIPFVLAKRGGSGPSMAKATVSKQAAAANVGQYSSAKAMLDRLSIAIIDLPASERCAAPCARSRRIRARRLGGPHEKTRYFP